MRLFFFKKVLLKYFFLINGILFAGDIMSFTYKDFNELNNKEQGKLLKGSIIPRPIAWVTTTNQAGVVNLAPFSYFNMMTSSLVSISFRRNGKIKKDTARNILLNKEAVINIPDLTLIKQLDLSSKEVDSNISEVEMVGLKTVSSKKVSVPGLLDAKIKLEAKLVDHIKLYDYTNSFVEADLIILRIVGVSLSNDVYDKEKNYVLFSKLNPISRLGGPDYGTVEVIKNFTREFF